MDAFNADEFQFHSQFLSAHSAKVGCFLLHGWQVHHTVHRITFGLQGVDGTLDILHLRTRSLTLPFAVIRNGLVKFLHRVQTADGCRLIHCRKHIVPFATKPFQFLDLLLYLDALCGGSGLQFLLIEGQLVVKLFVGMYLVCGKCCVRTVLECRFKVVQTLYLLVYLCKVLL